MTLKLTDRYASTLLKMEETVNRNEYVGLAKEANFLQHQMDSKKTFQEISAELEQWNAKNVRSTNE